MLVLSANQEDMNGVLAEFAEGDFFGGWFTSVGPSLYRAHKDNSAKRVLHLISMCLEDSVLLSISEVSRTVETSLEDRNHSKVLSARQLGMMPSNAAQ